MDAIKTVGMILIDPIFWLTILSIIGSLKVIARYTKTKVDDKALEAVEKPVIFVKDLVSRLRGAK